MRRILLGRFPILLIDESQDTNRHLVDALLSTAREHPEQFCLGLIGDVMQRIYTDGKEQIEANLPKTWERPSKQLNHRCPKRVVKLINKIREEVDDHSQVARTDAIEGHVRLFIRAANTENYKDVEDDIRYQMAQISSDEGWNDRDACKTLVLEHHMSAKRLGFDKVFSPLYKIKSWNTQLLDGSLPALSFFSDSVLPLVEAKRKRDEYTVLQLIRKTSPLFTTRVLKDTTDPIALLRQVQSHVEALMTLCNEGEPSCGEVLRCIDEHQLLNIPESLLPVVQILKANDLSKEDLAEDPADKEMEAMINMMKAPFAEIDLYRKYTLGLAPFDTHHGVKGQEFDRVMVIMNDFEARGFLFGYGKLLGDKAPSATDIARTNEGKENSNDRTRRLLYVTCSRAKKSLALVAYMENPDKIKAYMTKNGWLAENEVDVAC